MLYFRSFFFLFLFATTSISTLLFGALTPLHAKETDFTTIAEKAIPAVVAIKTEGRDSSFSSKSEMFDNDFWERFFGIPKPKDFNKEKFSDQLHPIGQGTGFLISQDGYILTNNHVINDADVIKVILDDNREFEASVIGKDPNTDIAVIKINGENFPYLELGNSDEIKVGEWVIAIGTPMGLKATLTVGVISAKDRNNLNLSSYESYIQTDAAINPGNSGGPLINLSGKVIAMNTAIATQTGSYMGIGFSIPSNMAALIKDQLIAKGTVTRGFLGVTLQEIDKELAKAFQLENLKGALIADVIIGSPAQKAGCKQGDVILKYNNTPVENIHQLRNNVALLTPGTTVKLLIKRQNQTLTIPVVIGVHPTSEISYSSSQKKIGIEVQNMDSEIANKLGFNSRDGVIISHVEPNSPGSMVGLQRGNLILSVNQQRVKTKEKFYQELEKVNQADDHVLLLVKQRELTRFISLKIE